MAQHIYQIKSPRRVARDFRDSTTGRKRIPRKITPFCLKEAHFNYSPISATISCRPEASPSTVHNDEQREEYSLLDSYVRENQLSGALHVIVEE